MQRSEKDSRCPGLSPPPYFLETGSLSESGARLVAGKP